MASPKKRSLRSVIIIPYIIIVIALVAITSLLSYRAGHSTITDVSSYLLKENINRIDQAIDQHLDKSQPVLKTAFADKKYDINKIERDTDKLLAQFWLSKSLNPSPRSNVYFGNEAGQGFGLFDGTKELPNGTIATIMQGTGLPLRIIHLNKQRGFSNTEELRQDIFDPRIRPWYILARDHNRPIWTPIYIDRVTGELVITRAERLTNSDGDFSGAVATDISLETLNSLISSIVMSENGLAMIVDAEGKMIASSISPNIVVNEHDVSTRLHARLNDNSYISDVFKAVQDHYKNTKESAPSTTMFEDSSGRIIHVASMYMSKHPDLNWTIIAAMPQSDFMGDMKKNLYVTALLCFLVILLIIIIGLLTVNWITADLVHLTLAVKQMGRGQHNITIPVHRNDEIGHLATSLREMQHRAQTDELTGLLNKDAFIKHIDQKLKISNPENKATFFAVVYINLMSADEDQLISIAEQELINNELLTVISSTLQTRVREEDLLCRCCHADFAILLNKIDNYEKLERIVDEIKRLFSSPITGSGDDSQKLQCNVGISYYPEDGTDALSLVNNAIEKLEDLNNQPIRVGWIKPAHRKQ